MIFDLILKGGRVIDPGCDIDTISDVAIADGKISAIEAEFSETAKEIVDVSGKIVIPGLIDLRLSDIQVAVRVAREHEDLSGARGV